MDYPWWKWIIWFLLALSMIPLVTFGLPLLLGEMGTKMKVKWKVYVTFISLAYLLLVAVLLEQCNLRP